MSQNLLFRRCFWTMSLTCLLLYPSFVWGEESAQLPLIEHKRVVSLKNVLEKVYATGLPIIIARESYAQQLQGVSDAWARWMPTANVTGSYRLTRGEIQNAGTIESSFEAKEGSWSFVASVSQPLFSWASLTGVGYAHHTAEAGRYRMLASIQDALLQTIVTYLDVLTAQASQDVARRRVRTARAFYNSMELAAQAGQITQVEMLSAQARLLQIFGLSQQAQSLYIGAVAQYRIVLGEDPKHLEWPEPPPILLPQDAISKALSSPDVLAQDRLERAATWQTSGLGGLFLPSVTGRLSYINSPLSTSLFATQRQEALRVEIQANLSLNPLTLYSSFRKTLHQASQRRTELHLAARTARNTIVANLALLESAKSLLDASEKERQLRRITYERMKQSLSSGDISLYDFYTEEDKLWTSRLKTLQARKNALLASYRLLRSTGDLTLPALFPKIPVAGS